MTAAAAAARLADAWSGRPGGGWQALAWSVVVAGGLVEGLALGTLQSRALSGLLDRRRRTRWLVATVVVAGVGWAGASAPSVLAAGSPSSSEPSLALVLAGAAALGVAMGALLGSAQSLALRGTATAPGRWVAASTLGWTAAMVVIFAGATAPSAGTPTGLVVLLGTGTGLAAGAVLGLVTHPFLTGSAAAPLPPGRGDVSGTTPAPGSPEPKVLGPGT